MNFIVFKKRMLDHPVLCSQSNSELNDLVTYTDLGNSYRTVCGKT